MMDVELEERMRLEKHIDPICKKLGPALKLLKITTKPFVPHGTLQNLNDSLVLPYFDYCSFLWDNFGRILKMKSQKLNTRVARIIIGVPTMSCQQICSMLWRGKI